jgi:hypothetical protein
MKSTMTSGREKSSFSRTGDGRAGVFDLGIEAVT